MPISLTAPDGALMERIRRSLPPQWSELTEESGEPARFAVTRTEAGSYTLEQGDEVVVEGTDDDALDMLDIVLRSHIAAVAPHHIFLHAGAVAVDGRALIVPGASFSGKTTLVSELVRAGAAYYSDEYAVIDEAGRVHPYPKPLSVRLVSGEAAQTNHEVSAFGGAAGIGPVELGLVVFTQYKPGAHWSPTPLSRAELMAELLGAAMPVQERPEQTMAAVRAAVASALGLRGERGEAATAATDLLTRLRANQSTN